MLNYAPYAKLCSAMLLLCKLCLMLGLCDYAKKQCWHNRAAPNSRMKEYIYTPVPKVARLLMSHRRIQ